jgi:hypothetical protein
VVINKPRIMAEVATIASQVTLDRLTKICNSIVSAIEPALRTLEEQHITFGLAQEAARQISGAELVTLAGPAVNDALETAVLARALLRESMQTEESIARHVRSAIAVRKFAAEQSLTIQAAKAAIEERAKPFLANLPPNLPCIAAIGYDVLLSVPELDALCNRSQRDGKRAGMSLKDSRIAELTAPTGINAAWMSGMGPGSIQAALLHPAKKGDTTLVGLFLQQARFIDRLDTAIE